MLETSSLPSITAASSPLLCKPRSVHTCCKSSPQVQERMYSPAMSVHIVQSLLHCANICVGQFSHDLPICQVGHSRCCFQLLPQQYKCNFTIIIARIRERVWHRMATKETTIHVCVKVQRRCRL